MPDESLSQAAGSGQTKIRVLIADDHAMVRDGIRAFLEQEPDIEVVGESADGRETLEVVKRTNPDVLLLDIGMPVMNGLDVCQQLTQHSEHPAILMLTMYGDPEFMERAFRGGAAGYCVKGVPKTEVINAIRTVAAGRAYLPFGVAPSFLQNLARGGADGGDAVLTMREREVLALIAEGTTTKRIAERLGLSVKTVDAHRSRVMRKLGVSSLAGLLKYALRRGLVTSP